MVVGSTGSDVIDLQRRLRAIGFISDDEPGEFGESTHAAVVLFQNSRGLRVDGQCGASTWSALIESGFILGDRLLCLRSPMLRGDDVGELQFRLGVMGFDPGRIDGIFGQRTQHAVGEFQRNAGLVSNSVCGPDTVAALLRLEGRAGRSSVTGVREREMLRRRSSTIGTLRVAVGTTDTATMVAHHITRQIAVQLEAVGSTVLHLDHEEWSDHASSVNDFDADVFIGLTLVPDEKTAEAYFYTSSGYESVGGRILAELVMDELPATPGWGIGSVAGMRLPILRETRPPAILMRLGDEESVEANADLIIAAVHTALTNWVGHSYS